MRSKNNETGTDTGFLSASGDSHGSGSADGFSFWQIPLLFYKILGGAAMGLIMGCAGKWFFSRRFEYEGLYYVLGVAMVLICFGIAELLQTNGFLAVYVCGVAMGNMKYNFRGGLEKFNEGAGWTTG